VFPTPTPAPTLNATPWLDLPETLSQEIAVQSVAWWNNVNSTGIMTLFQVFVCVCIILCGMVLIRSRAQGDDAE